MFSGWLDDSLINLCIMSRIESVSSQWVIIFIQGEIRDHLGTHLPLLFFLKENFGHVIHDNTVKSQFIYLVIKVSIKGIDNHPMINSHH